MTSPAAGYPLSIVELTRWNQSRPYPAGCSRHRTPQPLVAGDHETTGEPMWICVECGNVTPILDDEMNSTLGDTQRFTTTALSASISPSTRFLSLPDHPGSNYPAGTVRVHTDPPADGQHPPQRPLVRPAAGELAGMIIGVILTGLVVWALPLGTFGIFLILGGAVLGRIAGREVDRRATPAIRAASRTSTLAADVLAGDWIAPPGSRAPGEVVVRVMQSVRQGNTAALRITTTAGQFTVSDTSRIEVITMADPTLNDFTYHPRG